MERQFSDRISRFRHVEVQVDNGNVKRTSVMHIKTLKEEFPNLLVRKAFRPFTSLGGPRDRTKGLIN